MTTNLLDLLSNAVSPEIVQGLSRSIGESDSAVRSGVSALLPTLLGGLASKASSPSGASSVFSMLTGSNVDAGLMGNMASLLGGGQTGALTQLGTSLLSGLFGSDKVSGLGQALATVSGMKASSAGSLASLIVPMGFAALKRFIGDGKLDASGLGALLAGQRDHLAGKLDPRLTAALGLGAPASLLAGLVPSVAAAAGVAPAAVASAAKAGVASAGAAIDRGAAVAAGAASTATTAASSAGGGLGRWLPWIIGAAVLAFVLSRCGSGTTQQAAAPVAAPAPAAAPAATPAAPPAPAPAAATASVNWPAKIYFETGKAMTGAEGEATIKAVASAMAATPTAKISITGYTDKTGNADANAELAKNRALGVRDALQGAGVAGDRIEMKPPVFVEAGKDGSDAEARRVDIILASQ